MAAPALPLESLSEQLADAVSLVRKYRHFDGCDCCLYRGDRGQGFCSRDEETWNRILNQLLDRL